MSLCVNLMKVFEAETGRDFAFVRVGTFGDFRTISVRFLFPFEAIWSVLSFDVQKLLSASIMFPVLQKFALKFLFKRKQNEFEFHLKLISDTRISRFK